MSIPEVGKPYIAGLPSIEPRTEYNFRHGEHSLLLCFSHLTEPEVATVRQGETEFGLLVYGLVIFMIYRFGSSIPWSTAPYSWHLVPAEERQLPETPAITETRALLRVVLVDADQNIVRALRAVTLSPEFTRALHAAITDQAEGRWDSEDFDAQLQRAYQHFPTPEQMLGRAIVRTKGGI